VPRPSGGCESPRGTYGPGTGSGSITSGGRLRTFQVHVPTAYDPARPHPLLLLFHGGLGTGTQMENSSQMSPIADREGFLAVYPDGISRTWNAGGCCGPAMEQNIDDVAFVSDLLTHLEAELCVDRRRIHASGMSNGAMFVHRLGCDLSERVAAIAPVAGTNMTTLCAPVRPVPVLHVHGSQDKHVPWEGGVGCGLASVPTTGVPETIAGWRLRNTCADAAPSLLLEQGNGRCERQGSCPPGAEVVLCTIDGGGHSWPGGPSDGVSLPACERAGDGAHSRTFLASEQIWSFLRDRRLP